MDPAAGKRRARQLLARALENFERYGPGTYGRRDAVHRDIPNAIEAMIQAALDERLVDEGVKRSAAEENGQDVEGHGQPS